MDINSVAEPELPLYCTAPAAEYEIYMNLSVIIISVFLCLNFVSRRNSGISATLAIKTRLNHIYIGEKESFAVNGRKIVRNIDIATTKNLLYHGTYIRYFIYHIFSYACATFFEIQSNISTMKGTL